MTQTQRRPGEVALSSSPIVARRSDLDWLRVIAFGLLVYFHAAIAFLPSGLPMIHNAEHSPFLQLFVAFLHQFRLALLFLISGVGVRFALKHRDSRQFLRDRTQRLLPPLAFGVLVLVPPMVFLEKRFLGEFGGNFVEFYAELFTSGFYPSGSLSWHHFWFIAYLFLFCLLGLPVFAYLLGPAGRRGIEKWSRALTPGFRLLLPIVPLAIVEIGLRGAFPGFRDLIHDWASFGHWFLIFLAGFCFASSESLLDRAQAIRHCVLVLAVIMTITLFLQFWQPQRSGFSPIHDGEVTIAAYLWFCVVRVANAWCWLLVCLGFAGVWLQRPGRVLSYLNDAVYPLFCLHLPIVVALAYVIVPMDLSITVKYLSITSATVVLNLGIYELLLRRVGWLRPLVGLKPVARSRPNEQVHELQ